MYAYQHVNGKSMSLNKLKALLEEHDCSVSPYYPEFAAYHYILSMTAGQETTDLEPCVYSTA